LRRREDTIVAARRLLTVSFSACSISEELRGTANKNNVEKYEEDLGHKCSCIFVRGADCGIDGKTAWDLYAQRKLM
jgi:hypothetical protein